MSCNMRPSRKPVMAKERNLGLDAVKGLLIVLVVFGHLIEPFVDRAPVYKAVWAAIYVFHMPLFVILAGMFSKDILTGRDYESLVQRLLLPLIVFQALYLVPIYATKGVLPHPVLQPHWILWFLLSLATWRILLPHLVRIQGVLPLAVLVAILTGYVEGIGYAFSLSRTLYFLPFFMLGFSQGQRLLIWAKGHMRYSIGLLLVPLSLAVVGVNFGLAHSLLYGSMSYTLTGPHFLEPGLERGIIIGLSIAASIGFAGLAQRPIPAAVYLGQRSLTIFVVHGFVVVGFGKLWKVLELGPSVPLLLAHAGVALAAAFTLARLDSLFNAIFDWMGKRISLGCR